MNTSDLLPGCRVSAVQRNDSTSMHIAPPAVAGAYLITNESDTSTRAAKSGGGRG
jgi:hypothetical protein